VRTAVRGGDGAWPPRCCPGAEGEIREGVVRWLGDRAVLDTFLQKRAEMSVAVRERVVSFFPPSLCRLFFVRLGGRP
jgi:hypothetical protein